VYGAGASHKGPTGVMGSPHVFWREIYKYSHGQDTVAIKLLCLVRESDT